MPHRDAGNPICWEDCSVLVPAAINPTGPDGSMTIITDVNGYLGCLMADSNGETCTTNLQVSHGWSRGSNLEPHIHIIRNDGNNDNGICNFTARWRLFPLRGYASAWSLWENCDTALQPMEGRHATGLVRIVVPGDTPDLGVSAILCVQWRRGTPGGANTGDVVISSADLHVQKGSLGSRSPGGDY